MDQPNIILINCDDLGYGDLGCYGSTANKTPHLDQLAAEGLRLTDFYMASPLCSPSRGAMMTGCYPRRIGFGTFDGKGVLFPGQGIGLSDDEVTVAQVLKQQGYATKIVGKWHCGDQPAFLPTRHGFDSYFGLPYSNDMGRQANSPWPPLPLLRDEEVIQEQPDQAALTERYVAESVSFIQSHQDTPFFLYLAHMHVHLPHYVAWRFLKSTQNGPYGAAVEAIDWSVGVIMHELRRLGLDDKTLVIFTSDNGSRGDRGGSNLPLKGAKFTTWEGGLRVPCLVHWPGVVPAGAVSNSLVTSMDLFPTLAHLAGGETPQDRIIDGVDAWPVFSGQADPAPLREAFFYYLGDGLQGVRAGPWKLHVGRGGLPVCELYNLDSDLGETVDVSAEYPDVVRELESLIEAMRADVGDAITGAPGKNCRPAGRVPDPQPLTQYDPEHPYIMSMYDLPDRG